MRLANCLAIHELEEMLSPPQVIQISIETSTQSAVSDRTTRGKNNSARYLDLLPKKSREERIQDADLEQEFIPLKMEVINVGNSSLIQVYFTLERA